MAGSTSNASDRKCAHFSDKSDAPRARALPKGIHPRKRGCYAAFGYEARPAKSLKSGAGQHVFRLERDPILRLAILVQSAPPGLRAELRPSVPPFDGADSYSVGYKHVHEIPVPPDQIDTRVPAVLSGVVIRWTK